MCTLTFLPAGNTEKADGAYRLGMNRDERYSRPAPLPPQVTALSGNVAIYPRESSGGTWIGVNDSGTAFALLNLYRVPPQNEKRVSRGTLIPRLLPAEDIESCERLFEGISLDGIHPFRLVGFFPGEQLVREWRWDGSSLSRLGYSWKAEHWFSSGYSDVEAERIRRKTCEAAWRQPEAGSTEWLRRLHQSHQPERGAFSICAHREEAGSVSYTEIELSRQEVWMAHAPGAPCLSTSVGPPLAVKRRSRAGQA